MLAGFGVLALGGAFAIRRRIDQLGLTEPVVAPYGRGDNEIIVQLPGEGDPGLLVPGIGLDQVGDQGTEGVVVAELDLVRDHGVVAQYPATLRPARRGP